MQLKCQMEFVKRQKLYTFSTKKKNKQGKEKACKPKPCLLEGGYKNLKLFTIAHKYLSTSGRESECCNDPVGGTQTPNEHNLNIPVSSPDCYPPLGSAFETKQIR